MKKVTIVLAIVLVSCSKQSPLPTTSKPSTVYIRVESVELDGKSTYSPITVVKLK